MDYISLIIMVLVGALSGTLAARIVNRTNYGFVMNALLGIGGAVVGSKLFDMLNITAGSGIVKGIYDTFGVELPLNFVGMIVSALVGALIILVAARFVLNTITPNNNQRRRR